MKIALAAVGFVNKDTQLNQRIIIEEMKTYSDKADVVLFGEAFLQGFYGIDFSEEHDYRIAITKGDQIIQDICLAAKKYCVAVSFGFIEQEDGLFYSSQITIDKNGKVVDLFKRVSSGWKEKFASEKYCEGSCFHSFLLENRKIVVGLCGDLWFDENIQAVNELNPDIIFWPVYTDYKSEEWNSSIKFEYAQQAELMSKPVLYVNSYCIDKKDEPEIAKGGAALFLQGDIVQEIASGNEGTLLVEC